MAKILLVEDDPVFAEMIFDYLTAQQFQVEMTASGKDAEALLAEYPYQAIILDWGLPDMTGIELLQNYRNRGGTCPVLMLTGRDRVEEKEKGLDSGADDYLTKPFNMRELTARVRALMRRTGPSATGILQSGDVVLDPNTHVVTKTVSKSDSCLKSFNCSNTLCATPTRSLLPKCYWMESGTANLMLAEKPCAPVSRDCAKNSI
ncbi:MAG: response regulator [Candidatus Obscuribacter sp.]|nr:response regulator [Candidatus Obscuribacter sp.]